MHQLLSFELLKSQESVSQVCDRPCPFCQREFERSIDLQQHIAGHLEMVALLSLPNLDNIEDGPEAAKTNSNSANRNYIESKAGDFDHTEPLVFPENEQSGETLDLKSTATELFENKLKAESISFESTNGVNNEARHAYWSDLVGGWMSHIPGLASSEKMGHTDEQTLPPQLGHLGALLDQQGTSSGSHWLPNVFGQSRPSTLLKDSGRTSFIVFPSRSGAPAGLNENYVILVELPFENGIVQLYSCSEDGRSMFRCRITSPASLRKECCETLASLEVERSGPFLKFYRLDQPELPWTCLKFLDHEGTLTSLLSLELSL